MIKIVLIDGKAAGQRALTAFCFDFFLEEENILPDVTSTEGRQPCFFLLFILFFVVVVLILIFFFVLLVVLCVCVLSGENERYRTVLDTSVRSWNLPGRPKSTP